MSASKFAKFVALSPAQKAIVASAVLLLPACWLGLRIFGFARVSSWLTRTPAQGKTPLTFEECAALGFLINATSAYVLGPDNCLVRSLLLLWLLRRRGVLSDLRIGTKLSGGALLGHAWVEVAGQPVNDVTTIGDQYVAFEESLSERISRK